MALLSTNSCLRLKSRNLHHPAAAFFLGNYKAICDCSSSPKFSIQSCGLSISYLLQSKKQSLICPLHKRYGGSVKTFASQNQTKKSKRGRKTIRKDLNSLPNELVSDENDGSDLSSSDSDDLEIQTSVIIPSRNAVLQACTVTSGVIGALGVLIRQVSHFASTEGWPINDCSTNVTFNFELWHLELIAGSVILVSSSRFLLLKTWSDFAESSEAANRQVLTSLEPLDYLVVAFLTGISEEILFRGALLPVLGVNWTSILATAALFGILHLGSGRKYSFAIWATFVGVVYGYSMALASSITVPMVSHALNNLVGGVIWRYASNSSKQIK